MPSQLYNSNSVSGDEMSFWTGSFTFSGAFLQEGYLVNGYSLSSREYACVDSADQYCIAPQTWGMFAVYCLASCVYGGSPILYGMVFNQPTWDTRDRIDFSVASFQPRHEFSFLISNLDRDVKLTWWKCDLGGQFGFEGAAFDLSEEAQGGSGNFGNIYQSNAGVWAESVPIGQRSSPSGNAWDTGNSLGTDNLSVTAPNSFSLGLTTAGTHPGNNSQLWTQGPVSANQDVPPDHCPTLSSSLSSQAVLTGTPVYETAALSWVGGMPSGVGGSVVYDYVPSSLGCSYSNPTRFDTGEPVVNGMSHSKNVTLPAGTYYLYSVYLGDPNNNGVKSNCVFLSVSNNGGRGGGCVLQGTLITLANYTRVPVQDVVPGVRILAYNMVTGKLSNAIVTRTVASQVNQVVDINNGELFVSGLNDQALFARMQNGTQKGIVLGHLAVGMKLFEPATGTWVPITSMTVLGGSFTVYDLQGGSGSAGDYIGNNIVALYKT